MRKTIINFGSLAVKSALVVSAALFTVIGFLIPNILSPFVRDYREWLVLTTYWEGGMFVGFLFALLWVTILSLIMKRSNR